MNQHTIAEELHQEGLNYARSNQGNLRDNLRQAINHYEKALEYSTSDTYPDQWKQIQHDMAAAYSKLLQERLQHIPEVVTPPKSFRRRRLFRLRNLFLVLISLSILAIPTTVIATIYRPSSNPICINGTLNIDGSTALQSLVEMAAADFMRHCPGSVITVGGGASKTGLNDVEQGHDTIPGVNKDKDPRHISGQDVPIDIADSDIFASPVQGDLVDHQIAIGVFVVILNKSVTGLYNLSIGQIQGIYTGVYNNWRDICDGAGHCGPDQLIVPISRTLNSGIRFTFEKYVLQGVATVPGIGLNRTRSSGNAVQEVEKNPGSISYTPLHLADQYHDVTEISIDHQDPHNPSFIQNDTYKFWSVEHMYTRGQGTPLAQSFINYVLSHEESYLIPQFGFLNLNDVPQNVRTQHALEGK
jgi:phosphate transport system substrate-binding protein